jgi:hypothetical protein
MILQRLATSIRKQDWFTVVIETLIVVFGVYLGIQLGNWNGARADRAEGERLVGQLYEELTTSLDTGTVCIERAEAVFERARDVYEMLRQGEAGDGGDAAFREEFLQIGPWTDLCVIRSTLDELHAGRIALVDDEGLKQQILHFRDTMDGYETSINNLGASYMTTLEVMFSEVDFDWSSGTRELTTPFDELADNAVLKRNLESAAFLLSQIHRYHLMFEDELIGMHRDLAIYLGEEIEAAP